MSQLVCKFKKLTDTALLPLYKRPGDAAMDVFADESLVVEPSARAVVSTGIALALPAQTVGLVWDRSGMAVKHGMHCIAGVIDETYRGELKIALINLGTESYTIEQGDRIAQLLVQPIHHVVSEEVSDLDATVRGEQGFGSSGK